MYELDHFQQYSVEAVKDVPGDTANFSRPDALQLLAVFRALVASTTTHSSVSKRPSYEVWFTFLDAFTVCLLETSGRDVLSMQNAMEALGLVTRTSSAVVAQETLHDVLKVDLSERMFNDFYNFSLSELNTFVLLGADSEVSSSWLLAADSILHEAFSARREQQLLIELASQVERNIQLVSALRKSATVRCEASGSSLPVKVLSIPIDMVEAERRLILRRALDANNRQTRSAAVRTGKALPHLVSGDVFLDGYFGVDCTKERNNCDDGIRDGELKISSHNADEHCWVPLVALPLMCLPASEALHALSCYGSDPAYDQFETCAARHADSLVIRNVSESSQQPTMSDPLTSDPTRGIFTDKSSVAAALAEIRSETNNLLFAPPGPSSSQRIANSEPAILTQAFSTIIGQQTVFDILGNRDGVNSELKLAALICSIGTAIEDSLISLGSKDKLESKHSVIHNFDGNEVENTVSELQRILCDQLFEIAGNDVLRAHEDWQSLCPLSDARSASNPASSRYSSRWLQPKGEITLKSRHNWIRRLQVAYHLATTVCCARRCMLTSVPGPSLKPVLSQPLIEAMRSVSLPVVSSLVRTTVFELERINEYSSVSYLRQCEATLGWGDCHLSSIGAYETTAVLGTGNPTTETGRESKPLMAAASVGSPAVVRILLGYYKKRLVHIHHLQPYDNATCEYVSSANTFYWTVFHSALTGFETAQQAASAYVKAQRYLRKDSAYITEGDSVSTSPSCRVARPESGLFSIVNCDWPWPLLVDESKTSERITSRKATLRILVDKFLHDYIINDGMNPGIINWGFKMADLCQNGPMIDVTPDSNLYLGTDLPLHIIEFQLPSVFDLCAAYGCWDDLHRLLRATAGDLTTVLAAPKNRRFKNGFDTFLFMHSMAIDRNTQVLGALCLVIFKFILGFL